MIDFEICRLDINDTLPLEFLIFLDKCKEQGLKNNESIAALKFGKWNHEAWWVTRVGSEIVSISGCHDFSEYIPGSWRLMLRTATLKEYRGRAPGKIKSIQNDFNWGHVLPYQKRYAWQNKAQKLVFTTNSDTDGDINSYRTNRIVSKVLEPQGKVRLIEKDADIYYVKQNVWEIL